MELLQLESINETVFKIKKNFMNQICPLTRAYKRIQNRFLNGLEFPTLSPGSFLSYEVLTCVKVGIAAGPDELPSDIHKTFNLLDMLHEAFKTKSLHWIHWMYEGFLWSVQTTNGRSELSSQRCHSSNAVFTAKSSVPNVIVTFSGSQFSRKENTKMKLLIEPECWDNSAPTPASEASISTTN